MTHRAMMTIGCAVLLLASVLGASAQQPTRSEVDQLKRLARAAGAVDPRAEAAHPAARRPNRPGLGKGEGQDGGAAAAASWPRRSSPRPPLARARRPRRSRSRTSSRARSGTATTSTTGRRRRARPGDYVLDPAFRGYIPIPRTIFMVKFNPKPRLDMMFTTKNPGDARYRFVTAKLPLESSPTFGGEQFNGTANGSQIRVDMRAPSMPGNFRLYYQNDFFGSNSSQMSYRLQHFYGQYYGLVAGFTYGVFEDPDSWPDTVDYEGPNALIFARRPLVHYIWRDRSRLEHDVRPGGAEPRRRHHRRRKRRLTDSARPTAASTSAGRRASSATCSSAPSSGRSPCAATISPTTRSSGGA